MSGPQPVEHSNTAHGGARLGAAPGGPEMTPLERLEDWAQYATPRERWRMERDLDGIGVPYTVDEQGRKQRGIASIDLPCGEDVEYLWALVQAGPDLMNAVRTLHEQGCREGDGERCWEQPETDWPRETWCTNCLALAPLLGGEAR